MGGALRGLVGWGGGCGTTCCFLSCGCNPEQLNGEHVQQHRHESASLSPHSLFFPFQFTEHLGGGAPPSPPPLLQEPSFRTAPALITPLTVHEGRLLVTVFRDQHNHEKKKKQLTFPTPTLTPQANLHHQWRRAEKVEHRSADLTQYITPLCIASHEPPRLIFRHPLTCRPGPCPPGSSCQSLVMFVMARLSSPPSPQLCFCGQCAYFFIFFPFPG